MPFAEYLSGCNTAGPGVLVSGHLWVYASRYPPDWDCSAILEEVFSDFAYAGLAGIELMESLLRHDDSVDRINRLIQKYNIPVTGTSYYADMWDKTQRQQILDDVGVVVQRLAGVGGTTFGITVGDAGRIKSGEELDAQADVLHEVLKICQRYNVVPNLHNHTFEVADNLHDLRGTMVRVPDLMLGPDLNWLIRGGIDPVWFIHTYGHRIVYLHIRDQDAAGQWTEAVGEGVTDFRSIAQALRDVHFSGRVAIELAFDRPPSRPIRDSWKLSRTYVKEVFKW